MPGKHEGLVSLATYQKIQTRLSGSAYAPARKDIRADFPLRGFVTCADCGKPLTSCWSKGKRKKYPYYLCVTKGCPSRSKFIPRHKIEGEFETIVRSLQPTSGLFEVAKTMFKRAWDNRATRADEQAITLKQDIVRFDKQVETLLERIVVATNTSVIAAYEAKIARLELQKKVALEKLELSAHSQQSFETKFEHACNFLASPCKLWESGQLHFKRMGLRLAFSEHISYKKDEGFRTPNLFMPFKMLEDMSMTGKEMVPHG